MEELLKKSYQISLWEDEDIYITKDGIETSIKPASDIVNEYVKEQCIAIIGSDDSTSPIRAFEPKLTQNLNGSNTFSFQIFYQYYDDMDGESKLNPFINLLVNERKVKLKYGDEWFDFVIKQIQEDSEKRIFTYTCQDLYINELSKNGYELEFDEELQNNMGTVVELGSKIVENTDWYIDPNSDRIYQRNGEMLYWAKLSSDIDARILRDVDGAINEIDSTTSLENNYNIKIKEGEIIHFSFSSYERGTELGDKIQFFYLKDKPYELDEEGNITNSPLYETINLDLWSGNQGFSDQVSIYRGYTIIPTTRPTYIPEIERYCYNYKKNSTEYFGFEGTLYTNVEDVQDLLVNGTGFVSIDHWTSANATIKLDSEVVDDDENKIVSFLKITTETDADIINDGFDLRRTGLTSGISLGDKFICLVKASENDYFEEVKLIYRSINDGEVEEEYSDFIPYKNCDVIELNDDRLTDYKIFRLTSPNKISYEDMIKTSFSFVLKCGGTTKLYDCRFFKEEYAYIEKVADGVTTKMKVLAIPDLNTNVCSIVKDKYFFFNKETFNKNKKKIKSINDIAFDCICDYKSKEFKEFIPSDKETFEKITSISASKSNRFNLIQELCEKFECWAKFQIKHDNRGNIKIKYGKTSDTEAIEGKQYYKLVGSDISKHSSFEKSAYFKEAYERKYEKSICFLEYIGDDNYAGFRYGINLKSISRNIDSKQIVTKLIVEPNSNEFAPNGYCAIQNSIINPTAQNVIYNFQYYINHGLLNKSKLEEDLYNTSQGMGYFVKLKNYGRQSSPLIEKQIEYSSLLTRYSAQLYTYESILEESQNKYDEYVDFLKENLPEDTNPKTVAEDDKYNDVINDAIRKRDEMKKVISRYEPLVEESQKLVDAYQEKYELITEQLDEINIKIKRLNLEFFKKYVHFIQEGTWISEEFTDPDKYYMEACAVGNVSAFPQVSYTINVLEISQVEGYSNYRFKIGDKTYIEDVEFFGYDQETKKPYQEEVVIAEVVYNLDNPANNTIKVQNYKTQFQDLFQRIAATTQSLQYSQGTYKRAADIVNEDKTIDGSVLEKTLNFNYCLANAVSNEISAGGQVIKLESASLPGRIVRLSGLGIELSNNNGNSWQTAISADGINADVGVFGSLHTNSVSIYGGDTKTFLWNKDGLTAYNWDPSNNLTNANQFVRMDKFGIYGYIGASSDHYVPDSVEDVEKDAVYSLTWNGLALNRVNMNHYVRLSTQGESDEAAGLKKIIWAGDGDGDNFVVYEDGSIKANNGYFEGEINATSGKFSGTLSAAKLEGALLCDKNSIIVGAQLSIGGNASASNPKNGNFYVDSSGNVAMNGNIELNGTITWNNNNPADDIDSGLSEEEVLELIENNEYKLPEYITNTVISEGTIKAPNIYATNFKIYPSDATSIEGSLAIYGNKDDGSQDCFYKLAYSKPDDYTVSVWSPAGSAITYLGHHRFLDNTWLENSTTFFGTVDFSNATVTGLTTSGGTVTAVWG